MHSIPQIWSFLSNNQLTGTIPSSLGNLTYLEQLFVMMLTRSPRFHILLPQSVTFLTFKGIWTIINWVARFLHHLATRQHCKHCSWWLWHDLLDFIFCFPIHSIAHIWRYLNDNQLNGTIPFSLGNATQLQWLFVMMLSWSPRFHLFFPIHFSHLKAVER